eukprot:COSAG02_NODE_2456_length_8812_cov_2.849535_3_plen_428_part_00
MAWLCRPQRPSVDGSYPKTNMAIDVLLKIHQYEPAVLVRGAGDGATNAKAATKRPTAEAFASVECAAQRRPPAPPVRASARQRPEESDLALAKQLQDAAGPEKVRQISASAKADGTQKTRETKRVARERDNNAKLAKIDWVQCEEEGCGKWRMLPPHVEANELPDRFVCSIAHWLPRPSCVVPGDDEDNWEDMEDSDNSGTEDTVDSDDSDWDSQKYTAVVASRAADVGARLPKEKEQSEQEVNGNGCAGDERPTKRRRSLPEQLPLTGAVSDCKLAPEQRRPKLVGVQWNKDAQAWRAAILQNLEGGPAKKVHLGTFATAKAAAQAYDIAARKMRGPNAHGGGRYTAKYSKFIIQGHYIAVSTETDLEEDTVCRTQLPDKVGGGCIQAAREAAKPRQEAQNLPLCRRDMEAGRGHTTRLLGGELEP